MKVTLSTILHDLKRIAEVQRQMNVALDKVCADVIAYENGGQNGDIKTVERAVLDNAGCCGNDMRGVPPGQDRP